MCRYGDYKYDVERERMYKFEEVQPVAQISKFHNDEVREPWMLEEVEEHFARLTSQTPLSADELLVLRTFLKFTVLRTSTELANSYKVPQQGDSNLALLETRTFRSCYAPSRKKVIYHMTPVSSMPSTSKSMLRFVSSSPTRRKLGCSEEFSAILCEKFG